MMGRIFFWGLLSVLVVALGVAIYGLVGEFGKFQDAEDARQQAEAEATAPPAETEPAPQEPAETEQPQVATQEVTAQETPAPQVPATPPPEESAADPQGESPTEAAQAETEPAETEPAATEPAATEPADGGPPLPKRKPDQTQTAAVDPSQSATDFQLRAPIACNPGRDCWVSTYFDHDTGSGRRDHACNIISYDTHGGIDFAIANLAVMERGVPVVASAPGRVVGTRNNMADINMDDADPATIQGKDCGNGVRLDHGNGWATQYCHLKRGSIVVRTGQEVAAGDTLGLVGLSGRTQHPHVHLSLFKDGKKLDPYTGAGAGERACGDTSGSLWDAETQRAFSYQTGLIRDALFTLGAPDRRDVKAGTAVRTSGPTDTPELVLWTETMGTLRDHTIAMAIKAPGGQTVSQNTFSEPKVYAAVGIRGRRPQSGWPAGTYSGVIEIRNGQGQITDSRTVTIELR